MRFVPAILLFVPLPILSQSSAGELRLHITDSSDHGLKALVHLTSNAVQYKADLTTGKTGDLEVSNLPFSVYRLEVERPGYAPAAQTVIIRSSLRVVCTVALQPASVQQNVVVQPVDSVVNPEQAGNADQVGSSFIQHRLTSIPGRSLQDLVNSQPGWLYEGNAVLHPRGSEFQTQFVIDGIPITDSRSPSFGPGIDADNIQSLTIYTAGIPAEYGRKMGGVIEVNTARNQHPGLTGGLVLSGGSFNSGSVSAQGQYDSGRDSLSASMNESTTGRYLNPVVVQNYSNRGRPGDFSARFEREFSAKDRLNLVFRRGWARYDIPNEQVQQAAGQHQTGDNLETAGIASYEHAFSSSTVLRFSGMGRDNSSNLNSNPESTPVAVFQHNSFRETYLKALVDAARGRNEWKAGLESDNLFLHENTSYLITDPTRFDDGTPSAFAFAAQRPDLEQSGFVEDLAHLGNWTINGGLRWDHYQLLLNTQAVEPRFSISRYIPHAGLVAHFSYDRVFQTPSFENILLSSSASVASLDPSTFLRLPVQPSLGNYYEGGLSKGLFGKATVDINYFRRSVNNCADDDQIDNTTISFPIAFRKAVIYGAEGKLNLREWRRFSGFLSYSYQVGNVWQPVTGGLFLGDHAIAAETQLTGHFPDSQDQRNTVRGRVRYQIGPRLWLAGGVQYDSGLPFEFDGDPDTVLTEYGQQYLDRINFSRGRIDPALQSNASIGAELYRSDRVKIQLQADGENLNNVLDVIDFGGLFSGNAIGPPRSFFLRLTSAF